MKKVIKVLAVALFVLVANALEARELIIRNLTPGSFLTVKQINIPKGGKNLFNQPNATEDYKIARIPGPSGVLQLKVTNEPFTLQFATPDVSFKKGKTFNVTVPQGTTDKVITVDSHGAK